jgi:hypothetical protein
MNIAISQLKKPLESGWSHFYIPANPTLTENIAAALQESNISAKVAIITINGAKRKVVLLKDNNEQQWHTAFEAIAPVLNKKISFGVTQNPLPKIVPDPAFEARLAALRDEASQKPKL